MRSADLHMNEPLILFQGRVQPQSAARLTFHDAGFVLGATVTDLCRTFRHRLFRLADHVARFRESCQRACIPVRLSAGELSNAAERLVAHNCTLVGTEQELALVMCATPGPIGYYLGEGGGPGEGEPTLLMHTFPLPLARYAPFFVRGVHLVTPTVRQLPATSIDRRIKHRSRLHWWLAENEVRRIDPLAVALLLDESGNVTETAAANILIVVNDTVLSPPADSVLVGISLRTIREFCGELGIPFHDRPLSLDDCLHADEILLTGTSFCVAGVSNINGQAIHWPGKLFEQLLAHWSGVAGLDIRRQILTNR